ncbi:MAG: prolipoprotein diacylglyceryl transferase family protein [Candidatus Competibacteraceae bacterium]
MDGWVLGAVGYLLILGLPFKAVALPLTGTPVEQALWSANRVGDAPWLAIPSFHIAWSIVACAVYVGRWPRVRWAWWGIVAVIAVSCVLVGLHGSLDVMAGAILGGLVLYKQPIWAGLLRWIERLGNSWHAWQFGEFRIINHAIYSGLAGAIGSGLAVYLAGPASAVYVLSCVVSGLIAAGLWGQWVEGSSHLLRPFGYYGCLFGGMLAVGSICWVNPEQGAVIAAAMATSATFTQAVGRLRCVIQGCCHGRLAPAGYGIRIRHPRSRICALANLCGEPVYPTPLYSILANCALGLLLLRLWSAEAPTTLIAGLYLILSALTRFVEESYRGEPQTPVWCGLRLYQWLAVGCLIGGAVITTLPGPAVHSAGILSPVIVETALITGTLAAFLMSMDFPHSQRRFARLTIE